MVSDLIIGKEPDCSYRLLSLVLFQELLIRGVDHEVSETIVENGILLLVGDCVSLQAEARVERDEFRVQEPIVTVS